MLVVVVAAQVIMTEFLAWVAKAVEVVVCMKVCGSVAVG